MKRSCAMSSCGRLRTSHRIRRRTRNRHYLSYCRVRVSAEFPRYVDVAAGGQAGCGTNLRIAPIVGTSACTFRTPASRPCAWSAIRRCARSRMPAGRMARVFARIVEEMCRWTGARPPRAAAPSLAYPARSPDSFRACPVLPAAVRATDHPGSAASTHRAALRPALNRRAKAPPMVQRAGQASSTIVRGERVQRRYHSGRIRKLERSAAESAAMPDSGRTFGTSGPGANRREAIGKPVTATFAFDERLWPRGPDAAMEPLSRR